MYREVLEALYGRLAGGTALLDHLAAGTPIYAGVAPPDAQMPFVVYSLVTGEDENLTPRRTVRQAVLVKVVAESLSEAVDAEREVEALLHDEPLAPSGWTNYWLRKRGHVLYPEVAEGGKVYWHAGGEYEIRLSK